MDESVDPYHAEKKNSGKKKVFSEVNSVMMAVGRSYRWSKMSQTVRSNFPPEWEFICSWPAPGILA